MGMKGYRVSIACAMAVVAVAGWALLAIDRDPVLSLPAQQDMRLPNVGRGEALFNSPSEWAKAARESGEGIVRLDGGVDIIAKVAPPFTGAGLGMLKEILDRPRVESETALAELGSPPQKSSEVDSLRDYKAQLRLMKEAEQSRVLSSMLDSGDYLILDAEQPLAIPTPSGTVKVQVGPFPVEGGGLGQALFFIKEDKHRVLADLKRALRDVANVDRTQRVTLFNSKPEVERRVWFDRYLSLRNRHMGGERLGSEDRAEYDKLQADLRFLRVELSTSSWSWIVR